MERSNTRRDLECKMSSCLWEFVCEVSERSGLFWVSEWDLP